MNIFAKTFVVGERQLLVYIEYDSDQDDEPGDVYIIHQIAKVSIGMVDVSLKMPEHSARKVFEAYSETEATNFFGLSILAKLL